LGGVLARQKIRKRRREDGRLKAGHDGGERE
jgi:hypothetical protein